MNTYGYAVGVETLSGNYAILKRNALLARAYSMPFLPIQGEKNIKKSKKTLDFPINL